MMKKIALAAASVLAVSTFASGATAQITPGTYTLETLSGQILEVQQSADLDCSAELFLTVNAGGTTGQITGGDLSSPPDFLCNLVSLTGFNWPVTITSNTFTVTGVGAETLLGSCTGGRLEGTYSGSVFTINSSHDWTSDPAIYDCSVTGELTLVP